MGECYVPEMDASGGEDGEVANTVSSEKEIPEAAFYVTATDSFMSGWGGAKGLNNVICLPCDSDKEAKRVMAYLLSRPEMENISVSVDKPIVDKETTVSLFSRKEQPVWYGIRSGEIGWAGKDTKGHAQVFDPNIEDGLTV